MADQRLILVTKDRQTAEEAGKILVSSGKIEESDIEVWEEKTWDVKRKTGPVKDKILFVGSIKDTESLGCFIDISYERWGIRYGTNPRYAVVTADTMYIKDSARYNAFMADFNEALGDILAPESSDPSSISDSIPSDPVPTTKPGTSKVAKTFGTVGLAVATGGASLAAQKIYDDNKNLAEKQKQLCLFGVWHFAVNSLEDFMAG
ncbi:MAG: hypothetical protein J6X33_04335 [Clostridiales bacterium]|nr:hypothetical protein [Clostridiales bacterium]